MQMSYFGISGAYPVRTSSFILVLAVCFSLSSASHAQVAADPSAPATPDANVAVPAEGATPNAATSAKDEMPPELKILKSIEAEIKKKKGADIYERSSVPSLVFTPSQYALLREARIGFNTRAPTLGELGRITDPNDPNYRPPVALRDVKLGGIAFNTPDDWTIWLNGSRVTPEAIPAEALDIRVYREFIELRWLDTQTSQIFPIRLRTNQKFNLDTRIFLPAS